MLIYVDTFMACQRVDVLFYYVYQSGLVTHANIKIDTFIACMRMVVCFYNP